MFKSPFSFEGRIRRTEYGLTMIIYVFAYLLLMGVISMAAGSTAFVFLALLILIPLLWFI